jgi:hypothetical protein
VTRIVCIVEGHGEASAVPILVRRIAELVAPGVVPDVPKPIRVARHRLLKEGELERAVELAARQCGPKDSILVLLDADDDCPRKLATRILERARAARGDRAIHVVIAKMEYEAWFLAAAASIAGRRGLQEQILPPPDPEAVRDAKAWLSRHMSGRSYRETLDQPALTAVFDLRAARAAPSFDKMWRALQDALAGGGHA